VNGERLYELLPAVHRVADVAHGQVLRGLLGVVGTELDLLADDIAGLYDNWFVETCDEWVVPYIGDLLGVRGLVPVRGGAFTQRTVVANTISYRRRKGTAAVLEQLARDVSGWPAKAVEYFQLLAGTQYLNHVRPAKGGTVDVRDANQLELVGGPFEAAAHTADVRHIDERSGQGDHPRSRYNIPNVGLVLWRLQSYPVTRGTARPVPATSAPEEGRFRFSPLGRDTPLFNRPRTEAAISDLAGESNVPGPLRRRGLHAARVGGDPGAGFGDPPVLEVFVDGAPVDPAQLAICHLGDPPAPIPEGWRRPSEGAVVAVDPELGRLSLAAGTTAAVEVSWAYGFAGDLGGGPYDRRRSVEEGLAGREVDWQVGVTATAPAGDTDLVPTLRQAIEAWNASAATTGVIAVMDSRSYGDALPEIAVPAGRLLAIVAAGWPLEQPPEGGPPRRVRGRLAASGRRPHVESDVAVRGTAPAGSPAPGQLVVDGLLVQGALVVRPGHLGRLRLSHTTLVPAAPAASLVAETDAGPGQANDDLVVTLHRSISGPVEITSPSAVLRMEDSIVDAVLSDFTQGFAIAAPAAEVETSTLLGRTHAGILDASSSIFTRTVEVERRQSGCVRFSWLPLDSTAPRRFRCQPPSADAAGRIVPVFTSVTYGTPGYAQLAPTCPPEVAAGADDESEMGAFSFLQQPQRIGNLRSTLDEYLRVGLEAGILLAT
jgi:hypothetical protein